MVSFALTIIYYLSKQKYLYYWIIKHSENREVNTGALLLVKMFEDFLFNALNF